MPQAAKKTKRSKKPSQQVGGDVVGDGNEVCVMDTELREDGAMAVPGDGDTQGAGGSGLQGPAAGSGEELSDTDSSVERAKQSLLRQKRSKLVSNGSDGGLFPRTIWRSGRFGFMGKRLGSSLSGGRTWILQDI